MPSWQHHQPLPPLSALGSLLGVAGWIAACAPALSSFTPAHVPQPGHVQMELGTDVSIPTSALSDLVDTGVDLSRTRGP